MVRRRRGRRLGMEFENARAPLLAGDRSPVNGNFRPYILAHFTDNEDSDPFLTALTSRDQSIPPLLRADSSVEDYLKVMKSVIRLRFLTQCRIGGGFFCLLVFVCVCLAFVRPPCDQGSLQQSSTPLPANTVNWSAPEVSTDETSSVTAAVEVDTTGAMSLLPATEASGAESGYRCMPLTTLVVYSSVCAVLGVVALVMVTRSLIIMRRCYRRMAVVMTLLRAMYTPPRVIISSSAVHRLVDDGDLIGAIRTIREVRNSLHPYGSIL